MEIVISDGLKIIKCYRVHAISKNHEQIIENTYTFKTEKDAKKYVKKRTKMSNTKCYIETVKILHITHDNEDRYYALDPIDMY
jgi:hypothetical protein